MISKIPLLVALLAAPFAFAQRPPNFVLILADDVGYDDVGCFGATTISTPNIDHLAEQGKKFTTYYAPSPVCSPSRAAIMTGKYAPRAGIPAVLNPESKTGIHDTCVAEVLKQKGYATAIFGKWHLGHLPQYLPTKHGFDTYFGIPYSNDFGVERKPGWPQLPLILDEEVIESPARLHEITERITQHAVDFIHQHKDGPFFLYVPEVAAHTPWYVSKQFEGKSKAGPYGDFVQAGDWSVGKILAALRDENLDDSTLVIFTSDNGPVVHRMPDLERLYGDAAKVLPMKHLLRGGKNTTYENGVRMPFVARWPGKIKPGSSSDEIIAGFDLFPTFAALAGTTAPSDIDGKDISSLLFTDDAKSPHDHFFYYKGNTLEAVRSGPWKFMLPPKRALYNLQDDIAEQHDVAADHPEIVKKLRALAAQGKIAAGASSR